MKKTLLCTLCGLLLASTVCADTTQTVTINGSTVSKSATALSFNGDNVTLQYSDGTQDTQDMSLVTIEFTYTTGINNIDREQNSNDKTAVYTIDGRYVGNSLNSLAKGIYVVGGKKVIIK